jgi:hypothetical protein
MGNNQSMQSVLQSLLPVLKQLLQQAQSQQQGGSRCGCGGQSRFGNGGNNGFTGYPGTNGGGFNGFTGNINGGINGGFGGGIGGFPGTISGGIFGSGINTGNQRVNVQNFTDHEGKPGVLLAKGGQQAALNNAQLQQYYADFQNSPSFPSFGSSDFTQTPWGYTGSSTVLSAFYNYAFDRKSMEDRI